MEKILLCLLLLTVCLTGCGSNDLFLTKDDFEEMDLLKNNGYEDDVLYKWEVRRSKMKKIIMFLMCIFVSVGILTGCSSSDPKEVIKEGIDSNDGSKIEELYNKADDTKELDSILIEELENKTKEISAMSLEEFKETLYGKFLDVENIDDIHTELINGVFSFNNTSKKLSDEVFDAEAKLGITIVSRAAYNTAMKFEAEGKNLEAYTSYLIISNSRDVIKGDVLFDEAFKKARELEPKITKDLGVSIEMNGKVETISSCGLTMYFLPIKATNNSDRDIKSISGYYVAYDKDGYPLKIDERGYYGYFAFNEGVLKKGESREEDAFPDQGGIEACKFLITSIEYLNGGKYSIDVSQKDAILESWQNVVIDK